MKGATIVMKIGTERKWNMLIINIVLGIDAIDPKLQIRENLVPKSRYALIFMKLGT